MSATEVAGGWTEHIAVAGIVVSQSQRKHLVRYGNFRFRHRINPTNDQC